MLDKDSQLIYEAYMTESSGEVLTEISTVPIDPISFTKGDIITLNIGGLDLDLRYLKAQPDSNRKFYQIYIPVKDYSSSGPLPNITTVGDAKILYTDKRPLNIATDVLTGKRLNRHGYSPKIIDYKAAAPAPGASAAGVAGQTGQDTGRWTNDPKYKHSYRAKVADHGFFKNADVNSMTAKWAAHRLEKGFQNVIAPNSDFKRTGASRFATDPKQRYTGPDSGHKMNLGSEYEDAPKNVSAGRSKYKTK